MPRKIIFLLILAITLLTCAGCASMLRYDGPYEGKVVDVQTGKPIEGAVVHGKWVKRHLGGGTDYYDSYEMLTDKEGNFKIPGKGLLVLSEIEELHFTLFKAGYEQVTLYWHSKLKEAKWVNNMIVWNGDKATFNLKKLTMDERKNRVIKTPSTPSNKEIKLFMREENKENIEIKSNTNVLYPAELLK